MAPNMFNILVLFLAVVHRASPAPLDELKLGTPTTASQVRTSSSTAPIYTNTWALDCNVEGLPSDSFAANLNGHLPAPDILSCQSTCISTSWCQSYAFNTTSPSDPLCQMYDAPLLPGNIVPSKSSIFFSDKSFLGPSCFSSAPITSPVAYSSDTPTYAKTWVADCAVEGSAASYLGTQYSFPENDILDCQTRCYYTAPCISWAWNSTSDNEKCLWYNAWLEVTAGSTGVFFSDRIPDDNSDSCYSASPVALPESITNLTSIVYAKTFVADCAVQGAPPATLTANLLRPNEGIASDLLSCQALCRQTTPCISWAWNSTSKGEGDKDAQNGGGCLLYDAWQTTKPGGLGIERGDTGVWFSNKYPLDSSDFCFTTNETLAMSTTNEDYGYKIL
jgi:hypothetical protein